MGKIKLRTTSDKDVTKNNTDIKFTQKGNKLIEFTRVTEEERERLRVKSYGYIL